MATLFSAAFTGSANTALSSYTPETGTLSSVDANLELDGSGNVRLDALSDGSYLATVNPTTAVADFDATFIAAATASTSVAAFHFRFVDASNYWVAYILNGSGNIFVLLAEVNAGSFTDRGTYTIGPSTGATVRVVVSGTSFSVRVDGTERITYTSSLHQTATGMRLELFVSSAGATPTLSSLVVEGDAGGGGGSVAKSVFPFFLQN